MCAIIAYTTATEARVRYLYLDPEAFRSVCEAYAELRGVKVNTAQKVIRKHVLYLLQHGVGSETLKGPGFKHPRVFSLR